MNPPRIVLGPQRLFPTVGKELAALDYGGTAVSITAGWQEREDDDAEMRHFCGVPMVNLRLYARWEELQAADPELARAHRERQDALRRIRDIYRMRLEAETRVTEHLFLLEGTHELLEPEREASIDAIRRLDAHHLARIRAIRAEFDERINPSDRPAVEQQRAEITEIIDSAGVVIIAGGHVAVLLNRLQVFGLETMLAEKPVIAWSAGAMALSDRVVLFHDNPPQGAGHAEVFEEGLGLIQGLVALPHARHRLQLANTTRVGILARRFAPSVCIALDEGDRLGWPDAIPGSPPRARKLCQDGQVEPLGALPEPGETIFRENPSLSDQAERSYEEVPVILEEM